MPNFYFRFKMVPFSHREPTHKEVMISVDNVEACCPDRAEAVARRHLRDNSNLDHEELIFEESTCNSGEINNASDHV